MSLLLQFPLDALLLAWILLSNRSEPPARRIESNTVPPNGIHGNHPIPRWLCQERKAAAQTGISAIEIKVTPLAVRVGYRPIHATSQAAGFSGSAECKWPKCRTRYVCTI